jgi:hypothetical protein
MMPEKPNEGRGSEEDDGHDKEEISLRGLLNLFVLLLATYNYRFVAASLRENNVVFVDMAKNFWDSGIL